MKTTQTPITGREDPQGLSLPLQALSAFYGAFNNRDLEAMARSWAHTDDIVMDNPIGGIKRGWEEIRVAYEAGFSSPGEVYAEFYDYSLHQAGDFFYAVGRERAEYRQGDTRIMLAVRITRIFRLIDGRWQQVHQHESIDDPEMLAAFQRAHLCPHSSRRN